MNDGNTERPIESFDERLDAAQKKNQDLSQKKEVEKFLPGNILGLALRIGVELVSAIVIGLVIGWSLDNWFDTKPWIMIVFIILGGAAGILNVFRMANGFGYTVGYKRKEEIQKDKLGDKNP
jgi:ATP synthase protein I|tara:strand:- start:101 stop:466 length:366 start_codon:yes stop_codon:yes gene_type:complete